MTRLLFIFFLFTFKFSLAQEKKQGNVNAMVNYVISKNMNKDSLMASPEGMAYFFSVSILFNSEGKIDTVFYSKNLDKKVSAVMGLNPSLIRKIKEQDVTYRKYASKVVLVPILFYRYTDDRIAYSSGIIKAIQNLLPNDEPILWFKPWVILDPVINPFMKTH